MEKKLPHLYLAAVLAAITLFSSCKKTKDSRPPDDEMPVYGTCQPVNATGRMQFTANSGDFTYTTSGGGHIKFNRKFGFVISHDSWPGFQLDCWGTVNSSGIMTNSANHESLNGKHIKDRVGSVRTIVFPDGAKLTWVADGEQGELKTISIYDGSESHHINARCYTLESSINNESITKRLDDAEADGETGSFEFIKTAAGEMDKVQYINIYQETTPGNRVNGRVLLAELFKNPPTQVNDYYDDPRLAAT
ncbi:MAG: hypothetical protein EOO05_05330 [Chitinophagaceae bacterium]|nr:MAG: hypothetical protein EOO05_05330 [Chitinophagaceae bacterium]